MQLKSLETLARLVAFPTVSRDSNLELIAFCRDMLAASGIEARLVPSPDERKASLFATIGPRVTGGVVLSGHTDVVPVDGQAWASDPWTLTERDGRLYGRGTCDMKGFCAIALSLVPEMLAAPIARPIHLAFSHDEEVGCVGAPALARAMKGAGIEPSAVIVGEPSRMKVVTGHKGGARYRVTVRGTAVHSSRIDIAVSAVMTAARLIVWHEDVMRENARRADAGNLFEPPYTTLHCGTVEGGTAPNITAERCTFTAEVRAIPGESPADYLARFTRHVREEVEPALRRIAQEAAIEIAPLSSVPALAPETNGAAEALARHLTGDNGRHVVAFGTEGGIFQGQGWSTIVCGPGDIAQAHQPDEYIERSELAAGEAFVRGLIRTLAA